MNRDEILTLRKRLGLNQAEFATLVGVSVRTVRYWEKDGYKPTNLAVRSMRELESSVRFLGEPDPVWEQ